MMLEWTKSLKAGQALSAEAAAAAARLLLDESQPLESRAAFLEALAAKGETAEEIEAFVRVFLGEARDPGIDSAALPGPALDIVGTGGDRLNLFNVSTTAMFVLAGGGVCALKHGNRAVTSKSGGADVLQALGVKIDLPPERFAGVVDEAGFGFLFAPVYHPAFRAIVPVRQHLAQRGVRTIFNLLGPLLNPARPDRQLIGVYDAALGPMFREQMRRFGRSRAWVVHGTASSGEGMDEISLSGPTQAWAWDAARGGEEFSIHPGELGLDGGTLAELTGGDADANAAITRGILNGEIRDARRRLTEINAASGFVVAGLSPSLEDGLSRARESIDSGAASAKLAALVAATLRE